MLDTMHEVPFEKLALQRVSYMGRLQNARIATEAEIDQALAERETVAPEPELTPEIIARVKQRIAASRNQSSAQS